MDNPRHSIRWLASTTLALITCQCASRAAAPAAAYAPTPTAETLLAPWVSSTEPGVAVAVSVDGEVVYARGAGLANLEHARPIEPQTVFQVASVSKQFTAFSVLLLVAEGKIELDAEIQRYIPELQVRGVTVRNLLDHTGGLREAVSLTAMAGWSDDDIRTQAQVLDLIVQQAKGNFPAGARVEYSNSGYVLLAEMVARASGMSFPEFTQTRLFEPLGMKNTRFLRERHTLIPGRASSYFPSKGGFKNIIVGSEVRGATGLYTTALDLLKWEENFVTQQVGSDAVFEGMAERAVAQDGERSPFAKGQERRVYQGLVTWSHGGRDAGYRSFVLRVPSHRFALAILSNRTDFDTAALAFALVDAFLRDAPGYTPEPPETWNPVKRNELDSFAGTYQMFPGVIFTLTASDSGLTFASLGQSGEGLDPLPQVGHRRFMLNPGSDISIAFAPPVRGISPSFDYTIGLHGVIRVKRIELSPFDSTRVRLDDFVGEFYSEELGARYALSVVDGQLSARHRRQPAFALSPYQTDTFLSANGPLQRVRFTRRSDGTVIGFLASAPLAEGIVFERVPTQPPSS